MPMGQKRLLQYAREVRDRRTDEDIFIEGLRLCEEALPAVAIKHVLYAPKFLSDQRAQQLLSALEEQAESVVEVSDSHLDKLADTKTSQGIIVLAARPASSQETLTAKLGRDPLLVILHQINNPANAGAMIRVAEAAGACGVIATAGSADLFGPKALRGSMGSSFRLPIWTGAGFEEALAWCGEKQIQTVSTDLQATQSHYAINWQPARAILIGSESNGLAAAETQAADHRIKIPMHEPVESLNAAVALGVILYEAARQRQA